jgi:hypothetical protein
MSRKSLLLTIDDRGGNPTFFERDDLTLARDDFAIRQAIVSSALASIFRGKFAKPFYLTERRPPLRRVT